MTDKKVSDLANLSPVTDTTLFYAATSIGGAPSRVTGANLKAFSAAAPGGFVTANFDVISNTTLANVPGLTINVTAGAAYQFEVYLETTANIAAGIKVAMGGTATMTTYRSTSWGWNVSSATRATNSTFAATEYANTGSTAATVRIIGGFVVNAAGTVTVQFAQNVSNAVASTVFAGSNFKVTRVT